MGISSMRTIFLLILLVGVSLVLGGCQTAESTFKEALLAIETPIENCPNISGTYEFIGTPLPGMSSTFYFSHDPLAFDLLLWPDKLPENRQQLKEVEIQQADTIRASFQGYIGRETLIVPDHLEDHIGCSKDKVIHVRLRNAYGEAISGKDILKSTFQKNTDGSLSINLEITSHLRTLFFFWTTQNIMGAKFAPIRR